MYQIEMVDENILVQKIESKNTSDFINTGDSDKRGAVYKVCFASGDAESAYKAGDLVMLHPGTYEGLYFENELYTVITEGDIIARLKEADK